MPGMAGFTVNWCGTVRLPIWSNPDFCMLVTNGTEAGPMGVSTSLPLNTNNLRPLGLMKSSGAGRLLPTP